jgi:hypothetical protein
MRTGKSLCYLRPLLGGSAMNPESQQAVDLPRPRRPVSLNEFLQQFECMVHEKNNLESQLSEALQEKAALERQLHERTRLDFDSERSRLNAEIDTLRGQLSSRFESVVGAKERLIRDEFERKYQDLLIQVKRERTKNGQLIQDLKKQLSGCICHRSNDIGFIESDCSPYELSRLRRPTSGALKR